MRNVHTLVEIQLLAQRTPMIGKHETNSHTVDDTKLEWSRIKKNVQKQRKVYLKE